MESLGLLPFFQCFGRTDPCRTKADGRRTILMQGSILSPSTRHDSNETHDDGKNRHKGQ